MSRIAELRHKRVYGCRKKRLNTATFFDNHCMTLTAFRRLDTAYAFAYTPLVLTDLSDSMNIKWVKNLP